MLHKIDLSIADFFFLNQAQISFYAKQKNNNNFQLTVLMF